MRFLETEISQLSTLSTLCLTSGNEIQTAAQFGEIALKIVESLLHLNELSIDLSRNYSQLKGLIRIAFALGKLQNIQSLIIDLSSNDIRSLNNGHIFEFISKLHNLKSFSMILQNNLIIEDFPVQNLAVSLSQLTQLHSLTLDFRKTYLNIYGINTLFENISLLSKLENLRFYLQLVDNQFRDIIGSLAEKLLSNLGNLKKFVIHFQTRKSKALKGQDHVAISSRRQGVFIDLLDKYQTNENSCNFQLGIGNLASLVVLDLDIEDFLIENTELMQISQEIHKLSKLKELSLCLYLNQSDILGVKCLEIAISQLLNLEKLDLRIYNKQIEISEIELLSSAISKLPNLLRLTLCIFQKCHSEQLPPFQLPLLSLFTQIQFLSLELIHNYIGVAEANQLSFEISRLNNLQCLCLLLYRCSLGDAEIQIVSCGMSNLSSLSDLFLDLRDNQISNYGVDQLSIALSQMLELTHLTLLINNNHLTEIGASTMLKRIALLQKLASLNLCIDHDKIFVDFFADNIILTGFQYLFYLKLYLSENNLKLIRQYIFKKLQRLVRYETK